MSCALLWRINDVMMQHNARLLRQGLPIELVGAAVTFLHEWWGLSRREAVRIVLLVEWGNERIVEEHRLRYLAAQNKGRRPVTGAPGARGVRQKRKRPAGRRR